MNPAATLSETVYTSLRAELAGSAYGAGALLSEETLARRFRVSRTPVRKALVRLEQEGLVRILPKRGVVVPEVSPRELRHLLEVREALEGTAARLAAGRVDPERLRAVEAPLKRLAARHGQAGVEEALRAGAAVHRLVLEAADNPVLRRIVEQVTARLQLAQIVAYYDPARVEASVREHLGILAALRAGDAARAEARARGHVARFREHIFRWLGQR